MTSLFSERLSRHEGALRGFLRKQGTGLWRYEDVDDLVQGVLARAWAGAENYEDRGEEAFLGWLYTLARRHVAERYAHWQSLKRGAGQVLRYTTSGSTRSTAPGLPAMPGPGPSTRAEAREQLVLMTRALNALPERDQCLVRWTSEGLSVAEQARSLEISYEAAQKASHRAMERFRQACRLLS